MKLMYLIIAHKNPEQVARLIRTLNYDGDGFFIHIDKKCKLKPFEDALELEAFEKHITKTPARIHFVSNRVSVVCGGYTQVEATFNSLSEIFSSSERFDYLILLTGQDYPIKTNQQIRTYFASNKGREFLERFQLPGSAEKARAEISWRTARVKEYSFLDYYQGKGSYLMSKIARRIFPAKELPADFPLYWGHSHWRLTYDCAAFLLKFKSEHEDFMRLFRLALSPDEYVFHTVIMNSPFAENVIDDCLTHINWSTGGYHPKVLTCKDFHDLEKSRKLFARKFDIHVDSGVMDLIDRNLLR